MQITRMLTPATANFGPGTKHCRMPLNARFLWLWEAAVESLAPMPRSPFCMYDSRDLLHVQQDVV